MATPIWTAIIEELISLIGAMTIAGGYSFDYGTVNQEDPASRTYPTTWIDFPDEVGAPIEEEVVEHQTAWNDVRFKVRIGTSSDVDEDLEKVNSDFRKLLATEFDDNLRVKGLCDYEYIGANRAYRLTVARPADIILIYRLRYRTKKLTPYST